MPDNHVDQTPFDDLVEGRDVVGDAQPSDGQSAPAARPMVRSTPSRRRSWNVIKFLNSVRWPSPERLPTGTLVGLSMTAGALFVFIFSTLVHYVLPLPQSRFNVPVPAAVKPRVPAAAVVEIAPSTAPGIIPTAPAAVDVVHRPPAAPAEADVIKDPQAFEFEQKLREQRSQEDAKLAEARKLEDQKRVEERKAEDQKLLEQQRLEEDQRLVAERKLEDEKLAAARQLEDQKVAEARQRAEARKLEADQKLAETRKLEDQRHADQRKLEDQKLLQQRQLEDQQRQQTSKL